jgi:hypothetical protein
LARLLTLLLIVWETALIAAQAVSSTQQTGNLVRLCRRCYFSNFRIDRHQKLFAGDMERSLVVLIISGVNCPESGS